MARSFPDRTYRTLDDGERIEGTWRHVFIQNVGTYFLTDLKIYADGLIDCWGLVDLDEFRDKVRTGWVATRIRDGGEGSAHLLGRWRFTEPQVIIDGDQLIAEVVDTIAALQGAPTTMEQCLEALNTYLADRSEPNRSALRDAYLAIPEHHRVFMLGDMDAKDWPVRVLAGELGEKLIPEFPGFEERRITVEDKDAAFRYFEERRAEVEQRRADTNSGDPDGPPGGASAPSIGEGGFAPLRGGWEDISGYGFLSNDVPTPVRVDGVEYPSVSHAYWAMSTDDPKAKEAIRLAKTADDATNLGEGARRRADWPPVRLAVMTKLVRLKFDQHPDLADRLVATGDARITCFGYPGRYWQGAGGRNWLGRILEMVRSELVLKRQTDTKI